jgi:hypothetical protein
MAAPEVRLKNSRHQVKVRSPRNVALLDLATLGIYGCFVYYESNRELMLLGKARNEPELGDNPTLSLLALVPGYLLIVPAFVSMFHTGGRIRHAERMAGRAEEDQINPVLSMFLLGLLPPIGLLYNQRHLNAVWDAEAEQPDVAVSVAAAPPVAAAS